MLFFSEFSSWVKYERNSGLKFFFYFSVYLIPFWLQLMPKRDFLIFWFSFLFFFKIFLPGSSMNGIRDKIFFSLFLDLFHPNLAKNNAGKRFFNFFNFFDIFFGIFFLRSSMNGILDKFFFLFLGLSLPLLDRNNAGINFLNFLNFILFFFGIFLPGLSMNGIRDKIFFLSFSAFLVLFWLKIMRKEVF